MTRDRKHKQKSARKRARRAAPPPEFREAIAYMHGVADAVGARPGAGATDTSTSQRPTLRYGEVPTRPPEAPATRHRTLPYGSPEGPGQAVSGEGSSLPPEIALESELLERPSGIRLRCAPLRDEWYELAGASRRR
jgi:hypothetical protein